MKNDNITEWSKINGAIERIKENNVEQGLRPEKVLESPIGMRGKLYAVTKQPNNNIGLREVYGEVKDETPTHLLIDACSQYGEYRTKILKDDLAYFIPEEFSLNELVIRGISQNPNQYKLEYASESIRSDKKILTLLLANHKRTNVFEYASDSLRDDKEIAVLAGKIKAEAFQWASRRLKDDKEAVLEVLAVRGIALQYVSERLMADKEVVMTAISNEGEALQYTYWEHRKDEEIVLAAVRQCGQALNYAAKEMKDNKYVVTNAIQNNPWSVFYASERLQADPDILKLCESLKPGITDSYGLRGAKYQQIFFSREPEIPVAPDEIVAVLKKPHQPPEKVHLKRDLSNLKEFIPGPYMRFSDIPATIDGLDLLQSKNPEVNQDPNIWNQYKSGTFDGPVIFLKQEKGSIMQQGPKKYESLRPHQLDSVYGLCSENFISKSESPTIKAIFSENPHTPKSIRRVKLHR